MAFSCSGDEVRKPLPREEAAAKRVRPALERGLKAAGLHFGDPVFLRAFKEERVLELFVKRRDTGKFALFRSYPIAAASGRLGPKLREGDGQVPEGFYYVPPSAMKPDSQFHLAFNIGFPNAYDRHHGHTGSFIMIHGNRVSIGCLAMTDAKIEEIYTLCAAAHANGQMFFRVHVFPFRMTDERMKRENGSEWIGFWRNLKQGYDWFETNARPPDVTVRNGSYHFGD
ncbi:MAG TPA: murein L,D-transpeptidase family protein [Luteolibacter sp.]|nr:murein L,D-transpeptidase family protein [Luteolibacter sp.]